MPENVITALAAEVVRGTITLGTIYDRHGADVAEMVYYATLKYNWRTVKERWTRRVR